MRVTGNRKIDGVSTVYLAEADDGSMIEFVEVSPEIAEGRMRKKVVILSTQAGCPVKCAICDAGYDFRRNLTAAELVFQAEYLYGISKTDFDSAEILKIQFARMGEPALNHRVLDAADELRRRFIGYMPCFATIAPAGSALWFERLLGMRDSFRDIQLQFSIISTDEYARESVIPFPKQSFEWINNFGMRFFREGKRKAVLNFPVNDEFPLEPKVLSEKFSNSCFAVKLTPLNPTESVLERKMNSEKYAQNIEAELNRISAEISKEGFDVIVSIGNMMENTAGSNCGQSVRRMMEKR